MTLNEYAAKARLRIFERLSVGEAPAEGSFDPARLAEARIKGRPQMGTTRYQPFQIDFEFIYPDPISTSMVLSVSLVPPERIVYMPVPSWVVENIWQGDISGTFHFESEATQLVTELAESLSETGNQALFEKQMPKRRE